MRRLTRAVGLGLLVGITGALLARTPLGRSWAENAELYAFFWARGPVDPPSDVVIVDINQAASAERRLVARKREWPRTVYARLIDLLTQYGASVIAMDLLFSQPGIAEDDAKLADAIRRSGRVVLFQHTVSQTQAVNSRAGDRVGEWEKIWFEPPNPVVVGDGAVGMGPNVLPDVTPRSFYWLFFSRTGGTPMLPAVALQVHALPLFEEFLALLGRVGFESLGALPRDPSELRDPLELRRLMEGLRSAFKADAGLSERFSRALDGETGSEMSVGERRILRALARLYSGDDWLYVNFYGPPGTIPTVPFQQILDEETYLAKEKMDLTGKVVFVGASELTSAEQSDAQYTVYSRSDGVDISGVEIAATAFDNVLSDGVLRRPPDVLTYLAIPLLFGALVGLMSYLLPGGRAVGAGLVVGVSYAGSAQWLFTQYELWIPVFIPVLGQLPMALFLGTRWEWARTRRAFEYFVPKKVADRLIRVGHPDGGSELLHGTCLATDAEEYTRLSEATAPQELLALMNEYFAVLDHQVVRRGGQVSDHTADSTMSVWTADQPNKDIRLNACLAALDILEAVQLFNQRHQGRELPTRVGLHYGSVALGNVGGVGRYAYRVVGDIANTASRVEGLSKMLRTGALASQQVVGDLEGLLLRRLGTFRLLGKTDALPIFEILSREEDAGDAERRLCERFEEALGAFEDARWSEAVELFDAIVAKYPTDGPARFYLERSQEYVAEPRPPSGAQIIQIDSK